MRAMSGTNWRGRRAVAVESDDLRVTVLVEGGHIAEVLDMTGRIVIPGFVDSHTHLVFAGDRSAEFEARMTGIPYTAGGIRTTVAATRAASCRKRNARRATPARPRAPRPARTRG